ncbi:MAG TPA: MBOAT family protein [Candidatus Faeciplasma gallinarum]|uniref:MBOAT family protein n=1 Tax=Candidatus Faeciplasma gallinarum TaxID=2840799 RepID=A0A9D1EN06_9FIRM|nr:MBOAT family protein [Candidatus Faeciplasma gallinarum]
MLFSSIPFLYYFLPVVLIVYFIVPKQLKNAWIMLSSFFFYGWGEPKFLIIMIASIAQGYVFGLLIEKFRDRKNLSRLFMILSCVVGLGLLAYFKYVDFFISSFNQISGLALPLVGIALPIGISFFTFQIVSYDIDVYRGDVAAQKNPIYLAAYISMFSQLIAGPIVRYSDIAAQLQTRTHSIERFSLGIRRFMIGLSKKMLVANILGELVSDFKASDDKSVLYFWLYAVAYTLHIYFDFSGYSDMAIGLGRIMGFDFVENFNYPYIAASITDFWRRWHISLSTWFRDYVYIPLGGNRVKKARWIFNIFVVWFLTGLWHGAAWNFAVWGLLYAVLLMFEKLIGLKFLKKTKVISHVYTMLFVILGFVIFDAASLSDAFSYIGSMFGAGGYPLVSEEALYALRSYAVVFIIGIIGATPLAKNLIAKVRTASGAQLALNIAEPVVLVALLAVCTAYMVDGAFNPFLYFRF